MKQGKFISLLVVGSLLFPNDTNAQVRLPEYGGVEIPQHLTTAAWPAKWISVPGEQANIYGVYHFRKILDLDTVPSEYVIHVSADNRYKLFVNGNMVSLGPARCDTFNWNFETVDISPWLQPQTNVLAAVVWNYGDKKPLAQMSLGQTGFIVQGNGVTEQGVNTDSSWICSKNRAYSPWETPVYGYYVCGPGELVDTTRYPWGWESQDYDDSDWSQAFEGMQGYMKGGIDYPGRQLVPRPIPPMETRLERLMKVKMVEGVGVPAGFPATREEFVVPPHTDARIIFDHGVLTTGYPLLEWSGGKGSSITLGYTEAFYECPWSMDKGYRDEIEGKIFAGYEDVVIADGGTGRSYTPLWWRTWRYLDVRIETQESALRIDDITTLFSAYPFERESTFEAPERPDLSQILDIGWRTARLCANETYMDCPYYEQLQYFGDTRIQAMVTLYNTRDSYMVRNAIEQGRQSMVADGITMSRWPTNGLQFIPSFSLWWICMSHDYWMMRGDQDYVKTLLPAHRNIITWFAQRMSSSGSLGKLPYWFFADWAKGFERGVPPRGDDGESAFQDLIFLLALQAASEMERELGHPTVADIYDGIAVRIMDSFDVKYWDAGRGLYADTPSRTSFSQHVNSMAVLARITSEEKAAGVMLTTLEAHDIIQASIYFRYYLNTALDRAGLGDLLLENLGVWEEQKALGLSTWAEEPEPSRSDCHAWGSSPNVEFFRTVLGIKPSSPGLRTVLISPSIGSLTEVRGSIPHPAGTIHVSYRKNRKEGLLVEILLPEGVGGEFFWRGKIYVLKSGHTALKIK